MCKRASQKKNVATVVYTNSHCKEELVGHVLKIISNILFMLICQPGRWLQTENLSEFSD